VNLKQMTHQVAKVAIKAGSFIRTERRPFSYEKVKLKKIAAILFLILIKKLGKEYRTE